MRSDSGAPRRSEALESASQLLERRGVGEIGTICRKSEQEMKGGERQQLSQWFCHSEPSEDKHGGGGKMPGFNGDWGSNGAGGRVHSSSRHHFFLLLLPLFPDPHLSETFPLI